MVVVLRLTRRLLDRVGSPTPDPPASTTVLGDWFGHLVYFGHQRYVLLVSEHSRLPVLLPGRDLKNLTRNFPEALGRVLAALGIPEEAIAREVDAVREAVIAATNNRSLLGTLNDFAHMLSYWLSGEPDVDLVKLSLRLAGTPVHPLAGTFPDRVTRELLVGEQGGGSARLLPRDRTPPPGRDALSADPQPLHPQAAVPLPASLQLELTRTGIQPPIWRRLLVPTTITLRRLHHLVQAVAGWEDHHLHEFLIAGRRYGEAESGADVRSDAQIRLFALPLTPGTTFSYVYDFGDCWEIKVEVEKVLPLGAGETCPRVVSGARAFPLEDSGGVSGYLALLDALQGPDHPEHEEQLIWAGEDYDPEHFDLKETNEKLRRVR
jgi:hypothetical protein